MQKMQKMQSTCTGRSPNKSLQHKELLRRKMQKCTEDLPARVRFQILYIYIIPIYILYIYIYIYNRKTPQNQANSGKGHFCIFAFFELSATA